MQTSLENDADVTASDVTCRAAADPVSDDRYVLISPCRNEAEFMETTLRSVVGQTVPPAKWVIVDDGSSDATPQILRQYADRYDYIEIVTRPDRGFRAVGPGVIDAFYSGLKAVDIDDFDYVCKLDLDLELPERYFETLIGMMRKNIRLGTCSGKAYFRDPQDPEHLISEYCGDESSVGMSKFYRVACFKQIGGFVRQVMWDGIDSHRCRLLGWISGSWDEPELRFIHLRPMGSSQQSIVHGRMRHGFGQYYMGTGLLYMLAATVYRMNKYPFVLGALAMLWGYIKSAIKRTERLDDPETVRLMRAYQWRALFVGKVRATAELNARQAAIWDPKRSAYEIPRH